MVGMTHSMKPLIWIAALGIVILLLARAAGAREGGEYALVRGDTLTSQPRPLSDTRRTDLETLRPGDTIIFQEFRISLLEVEKFDSGEKGQALLEVRAGDTRQLITIGENSNGKFWPGGREGWEINMYSMDGERQTARLRAQRTVRNVAPGLEAPPALASSANRSGARARGQSGQSLYVTIDYQDGLFPSRGVTANGAGVLAPGMNLQVSF